MGLFDAAQVAAVRAAGVAAVPVAEPLRFAEVEFSLARGWGAEDPSVIAMGAAAVSAMGAVGGGRNEAGGEAALGGEDEAPCPINVAVMSVRSFLRCVESTTTLTTLARVLPPRYRLDRCRRLTAAHCPPRWAARR